MEVVGQPIIWLAVAALVFGSQVLSLAELWRKGQPYLEKVPGSTAFASHAEAAPCAAAAAAARGGPAARRWS